MQTLFFALRSRKFVQFDFNFCLNQDQILMIFPVTLCMHSLRGNEGWGGGLTVIQIGIQNPVGS